MNLEKIKEFARKNFLSESSDKLTIPVRDCAMSTPWMDRSGRFELNDVAAVEEWGLEAVLLFCQAADLAMEKRQGNWVKAGSDGFYCVLEQRDPDRNPGTRPCPDVDKCHLCGKRTVTLRQVRSTRR